jgi:hypothetical protein
VTSAISASLAKLMLWYFSAVCCIEGSSVGIWDYRRLSALQKSLGREPIANSKKAAADIFTFCRCRIR